MNVTEIPSSHTPEAKPPSGPNSVVAALAVSILTGLMFLAAWKIPPGVNFVAVILLMMLMLCILGRFIVGTSLGVFVNELNIMSLARFQLVLWTVVVLASYLVYVVTRMRFNDPDALVVEIDWHLYAILGISTTSLLGSGFIGSLKKDKTPDPDATAKSEVSKIETEATVEFNRQGTLYANSSGKDAKFTDLFQGDEVTNTTHVDLAKVQMFFFTVVTVFTYVLMVARSLRNPSPELEALPTLPEGIIALMGISHIGYLGNKSINHTPIQK